MPVGNLQVVPGPGEVVKGRVRNWQGNTAVSSTFYFTYL